MYEAKILADSIANGVRLTTLQVTMPRIVLAEFNTHRMLSRNSASSRAIPVEKRIAQVRANPFVPDVFAANQRGMQAGAELDERDNSKAQHAWRIAAELACQQAEALLDQGVHKQWANRLIEPFCWHTVIVSATEWDNFFALRCSPEAQPEIRRTAELMREALASSTPALCASGAWHLPLVDFSLGDWVWAKSHAHEHGAGVPGAALAKLSVARCARVSYLTHDGKRAPQADIALHDRLLKSGHMSPFEHAAQGGEPWSSPWSSGVYVQHGGAPDVPARYYETIDDPGPRGSNFIGNFRAPWVQYRKMIFGEAVFGSAL